MHAELETTCVTREPKRRGEVGGIVHLPRQCKIIEAGEANHPVPILRWDHRFPNIVWHMEIKLIPMSANLARLVLTGAMNMLFIIRRGSFRFQCYLLAALLSV